MVISPCVSVCLRRWAASFSSLSLSPPPLSDTISMMEPLSCSAYKQHWYIFLCDAVEHCDPRFSRFKDSPGRGGVGGAGRRKGSARNGRKKIRKRRECSKGEGWRWWGTISAVPKRWLLPHPKIDKWCDFSRGESESENLLWILV